MEKSSKRILIITLISIFVIALVALLIIFVGHSSLRDDEFNSDTNNIDLNQMKLNCINLGCETESNSNYIYAGSINSDKYYECDCGYAKTVLPENLICFSSEQEAENEGRVKVEC